MDVHCHHYKESMKEYFDTYMKPWSRQINKELKTWNGHINPELAISSHISNNNMYVPAENQQSSGSRELTGTQTNNWNNKGVWDIYHSAKQRVSGDGQVITQTGFEEHSAAIVSSSNIDTPFQHTVNQRTGYEDSFKSIDKKCNQTSKHSNGANYNKSLTVSKWDPSLSVISFNSEHGRPNMCSFRNESYMQAVTLNTLDKNITLSDSTRGCYQYSVFTTESRSFYNQSDSLQQIETPHSNSQGESNTSFETDEDVTIGTEEGLEWTDMPQEPCSYGVGNQGFLPDDEVSDDSCALGSDYYTDNEELAETNTPNTKTITHIIEDKILSSHHNSDADVNSSESVDEFWLICSPKSQQRFLEQLMKEESDFVIKMNHGIKKYLWRSRYLLQTSDFQTIFQNSEKLMAISNFIEHQMREEMTQNEHTHFKVVLDVYKGKVG